VLAGAEHDAAHIQDDIQTGIRDQGYFAMPNARELTERAQMFEARAERATDPISRQHYREMAAHYRSLSVEHQEATLEAENESAH
jgi:hypothetical protein